MGREESKEQAKEAAREKEQAAAAKKAAQRDKQWEQGARDTSADAEAAAKAAAAAARKAEADKQADQEGGKPLPMMKKCKAGSRRDPERRREPNGCDESFVRLLLPFFDAVFFVFSCFFRRHFFRTPGMDDECLVSSFSASRACFRLLLALFSSCRSGECALRFVQPPEAATRARTCE